MSHFTTSLGKEDSTIDTGSILKNPDSNVIYNPLDNVKPLNNGSSSTNNDSINMDHDKKASNTSVNHIGGSPSVNHIGGSPSVNHIGGSPSVNHNTGSPSLGPSVYFPDSPSHVPHLDDFDLLSFKDELSQVVHGDSILLMNLLKKYHVYPSRVPSMPPYRSLSDKDLAVITSNHRFWNPFFQYLNGEGVGLRLIDSFPVSFIEGSKFIQNNPGRQITEDCGSSFVKDMVHAQSEHGVDLGADLKVINNTVKANYLIQKQLSKRSDKLEVFMYYSYLYPRIQLTVPEGGLQVHKSYIDGLKKAMSTHKRYKVIEFFEKNGYYIPTTFVLGGARIYTDSFKAFTEEEIDSRISKFQLEIKCKTENGSLHGGNQTVDDRWFFREKSTHQSHYSVLGGDEALKFSTDAMEWLLSLADPSRWQIIQRKQLVPIYTFIKDDKIRERCYMFMEHPSPTFPIPIFKVNSEESVTQGMGYSPAEIKIMNNTDFKLNFQGFIIKYGKVVSNTIEKENMKTKACCRREEIMKGENEEKRSIKENEEKRSYKGKEEKRSYKGKLEKRSYKGNEEEISYEENIEEISYEENVQGISYIDTLHNDSSDLDDTTDLDDQTKALLSSTTRSPLNIQNDDFLVDSTGAIMKSNTSNEFQNLRHDVMSLSSRDKKLSVNSFCIEPNSVLTFKVSSRRGITYGPQGSIVYRIDTKFVKYYISLHWKNPFKVNSITEGFAEVGNPNIKVDVQSYTGKGLKGLSYIQYDIRHNVPDM